ncbi:MAG: bifunctional acetate--CoA ligase family protein/GNAT family N-acetyltransferase [Burkholderiales bacterium]|nr:bifunctional acetate--CoA ligase family protein/GNAT family N-acetyltransferase [Burkholderiales bacterium]
MSTRNLDYLFRPRAVAVIGASNEPRTIGAVVMRNLLDGGFSGPIMPVTTEYDTVAGVLACREVSQLQVTPDLAVICAPAETIVHTVSDLAARGTRGVILLTAGLGTVAHEGGRSVLQAALGEARRHLVRILGPEGIGLAVPALGLNASLAPTKPRPGRLALISQSGTVAAGLLDWGTANGIGFSHVVSLGESADVDVADVLDYLGSDPDTRGVLLYLESIAAARKFMSAARAAARNKPVIVLKPTRDRGERSPELIPPSTHVTVDEVFDATVRRAGMLRVRSLLELFGAAEALARIGPLRGEQIAVLTNGKALGALAAAALAAGDGRAAPDAVELPGNATAEEHARALEALLADARIDAVLLAHAPSALVSSEEIARGCAPIAAAAGRPVLSCWLGGGAVEGARRVMSEAGLPTYPTPEQAARALSHLVEYRRNQEALRQTPPSLPEDFAPDVASARRIVETALAEARDALTEFEAKSLLVAYQIPVVETYFAASAADAVRIADQLGYAVALKVVSPDIERRSEVAGVMVNLEDAEEVRLAARDIAQRLETYRPGARLAGYSVQRMIRRRGTDSPRAGAIELVLGVAADAAFGPVIYFGHGGAAAAAIRDRAIALPPLNMALAADLVSRTRASQLLAGQAGERPRADTHAVFATLVKLSQLVADIPEVLELAVDPLFADDKGVLAMEVRVRLRAAATRGAAHLAIRPYPKALEEWVELAGRRLLLRPIRGEDSAEHDAFIGGVDPGDLRLRFGREVRQLPRSELARLTQIDYEREMAFIATVARAEGGSETVGEVRMSAEPDGIRAEFAIVVRSDFQGKGLGRALMEKMFRYCRERGVELLYGLVDASNARMLGLARRLGFEIERSSDGRTAVISLDMQR